jgi:chitinase
MLYNAMRFSTKQITGTAIAIMLLMVAPLFSAHAQQTANPFHKRLLAYYRNQDQINNPAYTAKEIPFEKLTHLIHVAITVDPSGNGEIKVSPYSIDHKLISKAHAAKVRVLVCVQGPADAFSKVAANSEARTRFAESLKIFIFKYQYDGVDIDWEVPQNPSDVSNDVLLMQAIRDALPAPQYLVSMATSSTPGHWGEYDFTRLTPIVDFYNIMTYDFHGHTSDHSGHNSPLFSEDSDLGHHNSIDDSVSLYLNQFNVPPEKINVGMAFFGYEFPVGQLYTPCRCKGLIVSRQYGSYIKPRIGNGGWTQYLDHIAMTPYLVHSTQPFGFITYDDPASIARKTAYALAVRDLGGVFMWELSQDFDGKKQDLLDSMYKTFESVEKQAR